jgi:CRISPR/Cas system-associated exonuclease Cas4 (RecB family)
MWRLSWIFSRFKKPRSQSSATPGACAEQRRAPQRSTGGRIQCSPRGTPYIWVTWVASLVSGDNHCEWAAWFRAHYVHKKRPSDFNEVKWRAAHAEMVRERVASLRQEKYEVFVEAQNRFNLGGHTATLGGVADIVATRGDEARVIDCKTGQQKDAHYFQLLMYMMLLPLTHPACRGRSLAGELQYQDASLMIGAEQLTDELRGLIRSAIQRIAGAEPLPKVPSFAECRQCPVARRDCPERIDEPAPDQRPEHGLF